MGKKVKNLTGCLIILSCFIVANNVIGDSKTFKGKVVESIKPTVRTDKSLGDDFWGMATWVIAPGTFVKGPIYDDKGKLIRPGDVLVECDPQFYTFKVEASQGEVQACKGVLKDAELDFQRTSKLLSTKSLSEKERDKAEADLFSAKGALLKAEADLKHSKYMESLCTIRAQFDGFVEDVYTTPGSMANLDLPSYDTAVSIRRLTPLYVEVEMDRELARKIKNQELGISIYPATTGNPVGVFNTRVQLTDNGIKFPVDNHFIHDKTKNEITTIHDLFSIVRFKLGEDADKSMGVPISCLFNDNKGYYVWAAEGQKMMQPGKVIAKEFKVKKIYVTPGNETRECFGGQIRLLKDAASLQEFDALLNENPEGLKDNDTVEYSRKRCLFWANDEVKVVVN
jgi:hypothetical protein